MLRAHQGQEGAPHTNQTIPHTRDTAPSPPGVRVAAACGQDGAPGARPERAALWAWVVLTGISRKKLF